MHNGNAASSDKKETEELVSEFQKVIDTEVISPQQIFNCNDTGLFWKKMPKKTLIMTEKILPSQKPMKDRLTLLLCTSASGHLKVKSLLVYHSENPRVFRCKIQKNQLM